MGGGGRGGRGVEGERWEGRGVERKVRKSRRYSGTKKVKEGK